MDKKHYRSMWHYWNMSPVLLDIRNAAITFWLFFPVVGSQTDPWPICLTRTLTAVWDWRELCPSSRVKPPTMTQTCLCLSLEPSKRYSLLCLLILLNLKTVASLLLPLEIPQTSAEYWLVSSVTLHLMTVTSEEMNDWTHFTWANNWIM